MAKYRERMFNLDGAACAEKGINPDIFMPEGKDHIRITREAKAVCSTCPLVKTCLEYAIRNDEMGVWGGTTMGERKYLRRFPYKVNEYITALVRTGGQRDFVPITDENAIVLD